MVKKISKKPSPKNIESKLFEVEIRLGEKIDNLDKKIDETFAKYRDETLSGIDKLIKDYRNHEEDHILNQGRHDDFEERINTIEKIHPDSQHSFA